MAAVVAIDLWKLSARPLPVRATVQAGKAESLRPPGPRREEVSRLRRSRHIQAPQGGLLRVNLRDWDNILRPRCPGRAPRAGAAPTGFSRDARLPPFVEGGGGGVRRCSRTGGSLSAAMMAASAVASAADAGIAQPLPDSMGHAGREGHSASCENGAFPPLPSPVGLWTICGEWGPWGRLRQGLPV